VPKTRATFTLERDIFYDLQILSLYTRVPMSVYVREALTGLLKKYRKELKKARSERSV